MKQKLTLHFERRSNRRHWTVTVPATGDRFLVWKDQPLFDTARGEKAFKAEVSTTSRDPDVEWILRWDGIHLEIDEADLTGCILSSRITDGLNEHFGAPCTLYLRAFELT